MTPYAIVFGSFLVAYFTLETTSGHRNLTNTERWLMLLPLATFAVLYAGRIGTDMESYHDLFEMAEEFPLEPGFSVLMIGAKSLGLTYVGFAKLLAVVQILLLASVVVRLRDPLFFLLFYASAFFLNLQFNATRNSLALLIVAAVYVRFRRPAMAALLPATVIHYSSLITLGLQRLAGSKRQSLAIGIVTILSGIAALLWLRPEILGDRLGGLFIYKGYLTQQYPSKTVYPALLIKLGVVWLFGRNGGNRFYLPVYTIFVVLIHLISPVLSRLSDLVLFLALLDFCAHKRLNRYRLAAIGLTLILVGSSLLIPWNDCQADGAENWCHSGNKF